MPRNLFMNHDEDDSEDVPEEEPERETVPQWPVTGFTTTEKVIEANRERLLGGDDGEVRE